MLVGLSVMTATVVLTATSANAEIALSHDWVSLRPNAAGPNTSSACIDVKLEDPNLVQMWRCSGHNAQIWEERFSTDEGWFQFRNRHFNTCLAVIETFEGQGASRVRQLPCGAIEDPQQPYDKWRVEYAFNDGRWFQVWYTAVGSRKCLARLGGISNGTEIGLKACNKDDPSQQWDRVSEGLR
jgi:hypothetical protein